MVEFEGAGRPPKWRRLVATGSTYECRRDLQDLGFKWNGFQWQIRVLDNEVDGTFEKVAALGQVQCGFPND